ncbi:HEAT repeat domain-containing protein [Candidatus Micrarchaeota archaeon]|nr:HEAT repeat domain-containing protein [Candidatus Micrarchaeota archaeon]
MNETEVLMAHLDSPDSGERIAAISALGKAKEVGAVPKLIEFVDASWNSMAINNPGSDNRYKLQAELDIKRAAIEALVLIGDISCLPALVRASAGRFCGFSAVRALIDFGDVPSLVEASKVAGWYDQTQIYGALGTIGDERAVDRLAEVLKSPEPKSATEGLVAPAAAKALGQIVCSAQTKPTATAALIGTLNDKYHSSVLSESTKALGTFTNETTVADALIDFLGQTFEKGSSVDGSAFILKWFAAQSLASVGVTDGQYAKIETMLAGDSQDKKTGAIYAMAHLAKEGSQEKITALVSSEEPAIRSAAVSALRLYHNSAAISILINLIQTHDDPKTRSSAGYSLKEMIVECRDSGDRNTILEVSRQLGGPETDRGGQWHGDSHNSTSYIKTSLRSSVAHAIELIELRAATSERRSSPVAASRVQAARVHT